MKPSAVLGLLLHLINRLKLIWNEQQDLTPVKAEQTVVIRKIFEANFFTLAQFNIDGIEFDRRCPVECDPTRTEAINLPPQFSEVVLKFHRAFR